MMQFILSLFQGMSLLTMVLMGASMMLCVIEVFVPKFGITGIFGIALMTMGFSSYYIDGFRIKPMIALLALITIILSLFIMVELVLESKGVIVNPNRYELRPYPLTINQLNSLIGCQGVTVTNVNLGGKIEIDGKLYDAVGVNNIAKGSVVKVVGVRNNQLIVK